MHCYQERCEYTYKHNTISIPRRGETSQSPHLETHHPHDGGVPIRSTEEVWGVCSSSMSSAKVWFWGVMASSSSSPVDSLPEKADSCQTSSSALEGLMTGLPHIRSTPKIIPARRSRGPNFFFMAICFTRCMTGSGLVSGVGSTSPSVLTGTGLVALETPTSCSSWLTSEPLCKPWS
jgi:hypothetical protein